MSEDAARLRVTALTEAGLRSAALVHEARQPVFAMKALLQLARAERRALGPSEAEQLLHLVEHLEHLLEEHDPAAEAEAPQPFDLNASIRGALELLEPRRCAAGARIDLSLSPEPLVVRGRREAVRRVVVNLVRNAIDAVEDLEARHVFVCSESDGEVARVIVRDNGGGIPLALRPRLFEPFVTTKPPGRGTGLGLYLARRLVEEASGRLEIACPEEGGTRAVVSLPVVPQLRAAPASLAATSEP